MEYKDYNDSAKALLNMIKEENQATASETITNLIEAYTKIMNDNASLTTKNEELVLNNETLRDVNAKLFLKVGEVNTNINERTELKEDENIEIPSFEDLFNEKGELK